MAGEVLSLEHPQNNAQCAVDAELHLRKMRNKCSLKLKIHFHVLHRYNEQLSIMLFQTRLWIIDRIMVGTYAQSVGAVRLDVQACPHHAAPLCLAH